MPLNIRLTPAAVGAIHQWQMRTGQHQAHLRLAVNPGGCAGYFYTLNLASLHSTAGESELASDLMGITVVVPSHQYPLLSGLTLDYTEDLVGGSFRFNNPQAHQTCSCGHSFALTPGGG
ncbi:hypothetical protein GlitD10_2258 [Gloeomargarita lithophora Alchichica-D10]|uniref:Core domain-containing protein n=1 Tax=Gloeomargarita lithophora Alchichica-D10 TaxID=1188229 RepID=A0A1J0AF74_9CYAN|nr:iron-sulfur cluster assembly accessory protein [Gloeomargarita lithophora]APB34590.1 hypothetical protein GlitD10_2258 [Gloeomargarita lithophora Alchichica-D10]